MTYLVMETHRTYCVVLDEAGRFHRAANLGYAVGETLTRIIPMAQAGEGAGPLHGAWRAMAAAAACLLLCVGLLTGLEFTARGSVYLTINPAVRLDVNRRDAVLGIAALNEDGAALIEGYAYRRKPLEQAAQELVERAVAMGYLSEGGAVSIGLDGRVEWREQTARTLPEALREQLTLTVDVRVDRTQEEAEETPQRAVIPLPTSPPAAAPAQGESEYASGSGYGESDYETPEGESDYGASDYAPGAAYGESGYDLSGGESGYDPPDDGESGYASPDDGESGYAPAGEGQSGYDLSGEGESGYDPSGGESGYGQSNYGS